MCHTHKILSFLTLMIYWAFYLIYGLWGHPTHTHTHLLPHILPRIHTYHPQGPGSQTGVTRLSWSLWRSLTKAQHKLTIPNICRLHSPVSDTWKQNVRVWVCVCVCDKANYLPCQIKQDQHVRITTVQYSSNKTQKHIPAISITL